MLEVFLVASMLGVGDGDLVYCCIVEQKAQVVPAECSLRLCAKAHCANMELAIGKVSLSCLVCIIHLLCMDVCRQLVQWRYVSVDRCSRSVCLRKLVFGRWSLVVYRCVDYGDNAQAITKDKVVWYW